MQIGNISERVEVSAAAPLVDTYSSQGGEVVEQRRIVTGVEQGRDIVVTQGLKEGDLVIVEGIQKVHPGQIVSTSATAVN